MTYVEGFVVPVPTANREAYRDMARVVGQVFIDNGALEVIEAWGDDVPPGHTTDFQRAVALGPDETVVFSLVLWPSREVRDRNHKAMVDDPRFEALPRDIFDGRRMIHGGFATLLDLRKGEPA